MSLRVATLLISLFISSAFVVAQINVPDCNSTSWRWTFNSLNQSPCTVLAYMMSTCNGGEYTVFQLQPGWVYFGPSGIDNANLCECSTVGYSLYSACGACQDQKWVTWSQWVTNCTKTLPPSSFPNPVPSQIRVPHWVLLDVTSENLWNASESYSAGNSPELDPGALLGPSGVSTSSNVSPTGSLTPSPQASGNGSSNTGAIVGGIVGGVAAISIAVAVIFFYLRRRRSRMSSAAALGGVGTSQQPLAEEGTNTGSSPPGTSSIPETPGPPMRLYDPNDPTTFPGYQGALQLAVAPQGPEGSQNGTGTTLQTSRPHGYHGLPAV